VSRPDGADETLHNLLSLMELSFPCFAVLSTGSPILSGSSISTYWVLICCLRMGMGNMMDNHKPISNENLLSSLGSDNGR
jgi:hypothetical protein